MGREPRRRASREDRDDEQGQSKGRAEPWHQRYPILVSRQHRLNFCPLPHGHGSLRPTLRPLAWTRVGGSSMGFMYRRSDSGIIDTCSDE
jgi:hypothetical protein